jgi:erythromycin esterase-like protein
MFPATAVLRTVITLLLLAGCSSSAHQPAAAGPPETELISLVREAARPISGVSDYDPLLDLIGDVRVVLLGEATHGTHEFYRDRAQITKRLIQEKGFSAVAIEGDWPDAYRANRYVRGWGSDANASAALASFERFPTWMWRNTDVLEFIGWLRTYNQALPADAPEVGFYGLDLYSLFPSIEASIAYLDRTDPAAAGRARTRYGCFDRYRPDPVAYGQAVESNAARSCAQGVAEQLREVERMSAQPGEQGREDLLSLLQNARAIAGAEEYYRNLFVRGVSTWNLRDRHMMATLEMLMRHLDTPSRPAKVVVWAHNSHVGDARATHMGDQGELNIGQLARQRWGTDAVLVGFTTYTGTVRAASEWGAPPELKRVRPALPESYENVFHAAGVPNFLLIMRGQRPVSEALRPPRLERAIGVIYLPQSERVSHYFHARLPDQFDAVIHLDETRAVDPLGNR